MDINEKIELLARLRKGPVELKFTKANGEVRVMRATLEPSRLSESAPPSKNKGGKVGDSSVNDDAEDPRIVVLDLEKKAWRSFNADTVLSARDAN
jgi:hypothetical protein